MPKEKVDVLIIGSGHSGGMAANILTSKGISCLLLNAGPVVDLHKDRQLRQAYELPYRAFGQPGRLPHVFQANEFNANTWVDEKEVPYTCAAEHSYNWVRVRLFGGRSLFWGRKSFRLSDYEFKAKDHDGFGDNWPISLADLAPYYSRVESIFRVQGNQDGLPQYPEGTSSLIPLHGRNRCSVSSQPASHLGFRCASLVIRWATMAGRVLSICCCRRHSVQAS
jgi:choline dehydrogenase-like flavoprotein